MREAAFVAFVAMSTGLIGIVLGFHYRGIREDRVIRAALLAGAEQGFAAGLSQGAARTIYKTPSDCAEAFLQGGLVQ